MKDDDGVAAELLVIDGCPPEAPNPLRSQVEIKSLSGFNRGPETVQIELSRIRI